MKDEKYSSKLNKMSPIDSDALLKRIARVFEDNKNLVFSRGPFNSFYVYLDEPTLNDEPPMKEESPTNDDEPIQDMIKDEEELPKDEDEKDEEEDESEPFFKEGAISLYQKEPTPPKDDDENDEKEENEGADRCLHAYYYKEEKYHTYTNVLDNQVNMNPIAFEIIIDWIVIFCSNRITFIRDVLYLTVHILKEFLKRTPNLERTEILTILAGCLYIAHRYEEVYYYDTKLFLIYCESCCTVNVLLETEIKILTVLNFRIMVPTILTFLKQYITVSGLLDTDIANVAYYAAEITLQKQEYSTYLYSEIAAAAVYIAIKIEGNMNWNDSLKHNTGYTEEHISVIADKIEETLRSKPNETKTGRLLVGVRNRYRNHKRGNVTKYFQ